MTYAWASPISHCSRTALSSTISNSPVAAVIAPSTSPGSLWSRLRLRWWRQVRGPLVPNERGSVPSSLLSVPAGVTTGVERGLSARRRDQRGSHRQGPAPDPRCLPVPGRCQNRASPRVGIPGQRRPRPVQGSRLTADHVQGLLLRLRNRIRQPVVSRALDRANRESRAGQRRANDTRIGAALAVGGTMSGRWSPGYRQAGSQCLRRRL